MIQVPTPPDQKEQAIVVAAFYKFVPLADYKERRPHLQTFCLRMHIRGTILLAREGINGTISGSHDAIQALMTYFAEQPAFADITPKFSFASAQPFHRMRVRLKAEIVSMGKPDIDPTATGAYVAPDKWNALMARDDTLVIDTRNHYEVAIGTFEGAIDPKTKSFREFPQWIDNYLQALPADKQPKNIAMFCTGGIRCEKATAYLVSRGVANVFHLKGGILKYLEETAPDNSKWTGDCFVFDQRVSVQDGLKQGVYDMCHACRMPVSAADKTDPAYVEGITCPHCINTRDEGDRARFRERQKQIALAKTRGQQHIGQKS